MLWVKKKQQKKVWTEKYHLLPTSIVFLNPVLIK
jgi:hypothetical protein